MKTVLLVVGGIAVQAVSSTALAEPKPSAWLERCRAAVEDARTHSAKLDPQFGKVHPELTDAKGKDDDELVKLEFPLPKPENAGFKLTVVHPATDGTNKAAWTDASEKTSAGPQLFLQRNGPHGHAYITALGWPSATLAQLATTWRTAVDTCFGDHPQ